MTSPEQPDPAPRATPGDDLPEPIIEPRGGWLPSLVWVIPLLAALIGISLVIKTIVGRGPTITISFTTADGLEPHKTMVKYKDVDVGEVQGIKLTPDLSRVEVTVQLTKEAEDFAVADTRFWVVRPRVAASGVSGLNTLLSGSYIGVDAGKSQDSRSDFVGLEVPPAVTGDQKGHQFTLHGDSLGSLDIGSPVFYRRVQVGQVVAFNLDHDGTGVTLGVFVNAPYDQYVGNDTRFWHASGVDVRLDSSGFKINTQSLAAVIVGGIAFQTPPNEAIGTPAPDNASFKLASDESSAMKAPDGQPIQVVMNFNQSLRGLSVGATVDFRGIELGAVRSIGIEYDKTTHDFKMPVTVDLYPDRLGHDFHAAIEGEGPNKELIQAMVKHGLRAQLRTGNLLTSQLYVAMDFFPKAAPVKLDVTQTPLELPTLPNSLDQLQVQVADIAKKLDQIPFDQIGNNLNSTLKNADQLFQQLNTQIAPEARQTLEAARKTFGSAQATLQQDSPLQSDVHQALQELTRTLPSLNALSDYLERHPESLLRGKPGDKQ
jgi:paraquat-inducible protein B